MQNIIICVLKMLSEWLVRGTDWGNAGYASKSTSRNHWFAQGFCDSVTWSLEHENIGIPCRFGGGFVTPFRPRMDFPQNVIFIALKCCSKSHPVRIGIWRTLDRFKTIATTIGLRNEYAYLHSERCMQKPYIILVIFDDSCSPDSALFRILTKTFPILL